METDTRQEECGKIDEAQKERQWLQKLVGEWTAKGEATASPAEAPETFEGTESVRSIGDLWVVAEGHGEMPGGGEAHMITTIGYDPRKEQYVGTFIASMMTHLWVYEGSLNATEKALSLDAVGPSMAEEGAVAQFKDVIEFQDDDHRTLTSYMLGDEGNWQQIMKTNYSRMK